MLNYGYIVSGQSSMRGRDIADTTNSNQYSSYIGQSQNPQFFWLRHEVDLIARGGCALLEQKKNGGTAKPKTSTSSSNRARRDY